MSSGGQTNVDLTLFFLGAEDESGGVLRLAIHFFDIFLLRLKKNEKINKVGLRVFCVGVAEKIIFKYPNSNTVV